MSATKTVLITGASGFIATHVVREFLEHGYNVVGSVRSEQTADKIKKTHAQFGDRLSFAIVPDVATPGAHDDAVKGVDGVIHMASPFVTKVEDNERDLLEPAVKGTHGVLESVKKNNPNVKRVVITSSFAAIVDLAQGLRPGYTYTEADWNPADWEAGKNSEDGSFTYCASKKLAEKAAFDYVKNEKPNFTVSAINPPMVYGPAEQPITDLSKLNTSSADFYRLMDGSEKDVPQTNFYACVDVRDVATAHRLAYETPAAANQRYFVGGSYSYQMLCDALRKIPEIRGRVPEGKPGSGVGVEVYGVDDSKARRELGMKFDISLEQTAHDTARQFLAIEKDIGRP